MRRPAHPQFRDWDSLTCVAADRAWDGKPYRPLEHASIGGPEAVHALPLNAQLLENAPSAVERASPIQHHVRELSPVAGTGQRCDRDGRTKDPHARDRGGMTISASADPPVTTPPTRSPPGMLKPPLPKPRIPLHTPLTW